MSAGLRGERAGEFLLVLRVAGLDVVIGNGLNELALVGRQLLVESATVGQPLVVVRVGRIIVTGSAPVGFERLLNDLMAHEGDVKPATRLVHGLSGVEVVASYVKPVGGFVCCHFRCSFVVYGDKDTSFSRNTCTFSPKKLQREQKKRRAFVTLRLVIVCSFRKGRNEFQYLPIGE